MTFSMQKTIAQNFQIDSWAQVDTNDQGVCIYEIYRDGETLSRGTLIQLYNEATDIGDVHV